MKPKMLITGHRGLLGSACSRHFSEACDVLTVQYDLRKPGNIQHSLQYMKPDVVIHCAAKVGGVKANKEFPVQFLLDNLKMQNNVIEGCYEHGVKRLISVGTSCLFPRDALMPVHEESLLTGPFEPAVEAYSIAKLAGWRLCKAYQEQYGCNFSTVCPSNIYGPGDQYGDTAHVVPALIARYFECVKTGRPLVVWGDGSAIREFIYADDVASAIDTVIQKWDSPELINIGTGISTTIHQLAYQVRASCPEKMRVDIEWDTTKPTGIPRKTFDTSKMEGLGWKATVGLEEGLRRTWADFIEANRLGIVRK